MRTEVQTSGIVIDVKTGSTVFKNKINFIINAVLSVEKPKIVIDKKLEARAEEFRGWFGTMFPICNEYATLLSHANSYSNTKDDPVMDGSLNNQYLMSLMNMSLQIWIAKMIRNQ